MDSNINASKKVCDNPSLNMVTLTEKQSALNPGSPWISNDDLKNCSLSKHIQIARGGLGHRVTVVHQQTNIGHGFNIKGDFQRCMMVFQ